MEIIKFRYRVQSPEGLITTHILTLEALELGKTFFYECFKFGWKILSRDRFIGILDKNGQEIYDGDIIQHVTTEGVILIKEIFWNEHKARFNIGNVGFDDFYNSGFTMSSQRVEVIGNKYNNPELLT